MHMKHLKHLKHLKHTFATCFATCEEGRESKIRKRAQDMPEKPTPDLATPDFVMSRAKVECHGSVDVDNGHALLVGNDNVCGTSTP